MQKVYTAKFYWETSTVRANLECTSFQTSSLPTSFCLRMGFLASCTTCMQNNRAERMLRMGAWGVHLLPISLDNLRLPSDKPVCIVHASWRQESDTGMSFSKWDAVFFFWIVRNIFGRSDVLFLTSLPFPVVATFQRSVPFFLCNFKHTH